LSRPSLRLWSPASGEGSGDSKKALAGHMDLWYTTIRMNVGNDPFSEGEGG